MSSKIFVTVSGVDKVGIVAKVTTVLAQYEVKEIKEAITKTGAEMGMEVWVQKKEIFDNMHNI